MLGKRGLTTYILLLKCLGEQLNQPKLNQIKPACPLTSNLLSQTDHHLGYSPEVKHEIYLAGELPISSDLQKRCPVL